MSVDKGTSLYLQVEEALHEFQSGVTKLKNQQTETGALLDRGKEALDNLVCQIARINKLQEEVESDLRLLERFRAALQEEIGQLRTEIAKELGQQERQTVQALENVKTDLSVRRHELLGLVRDLRQDLQAAEQCRSQGHAALAARLDSGLEDMEKRAQELESQVRTLSNGHCGQAARLDRLERKNKHLLWIGAALVIAALIAAVL